MKLALTAEGTHDQLRAALEEVIGRLDFTGYRDTDFTAVKGRFVMDTTYPAYAEDACPLCGGEK